MRCGHTQASFSRRSSKLLQKIDLCSCLKDVENNDIYYHLRQIAMLIREPELAYNDENKRLPREGRARGQYHGNYNSGTYNGKAQP